MKTNLKATSLLSGAKSIFKKLSIAAIALLGTTNAFAAYDTHHAVVLDVTEANYENEYQKRNVYSAEYIMDVAGIPYSYETDVNTAVNGASLILISSPIHSWTFTADQWEILKKFVYDGGLLISPAIVQVNKYMREIFGIKSVLYSKDAANAYTWEGDEPELMYFDDPMEITVSLSKNAKKMTTTKYTISTAKPLAYYTDIDSVAVTKNHYGQGIAYAFGVEWGEVIQRNHLNQDYSACRTKDSMFEPSGDAYPFFVRAAYCSHLPYSHWKYTVPKGYSSVLIPTHDCDSRTAYDAMHYIADYEQSIGLRAHFFLTVHYFRDPGYLSAFYCEETIPAARKLVEQGHTIGSHSVSHFPDFNVDARFPMEEFTREDYANYAHRDTLTKTSRGSTWAEFTLSKRILEEDLGVKVKAFRSGHLCVNSYFPEAHVKAGYSLSSCYNANDVLTQFPFPQRMRNAWEEELTGVVQIPIHFSDVFKTSGGMNDNNWQEKPEIWWQEFQKYAANFAPAVLLVHPNREWKMMAERQLIDKFDPEYHGVYNFEDYGRFWHNRTFAEYDVSFDLDNNAVVVYMDPSTIKENGDLGIAIETPGTTITSAKLVDFDGNEYPCHIKRTKREGLSVVVIDKMQTPAPYFITTDEIVERGDRAIIADDEYYAEIFYSSGDETPIAGRNPYPKDGVPVTKEGPISAIARADGMEPSEVVSKHFSLFHPEGDANGDNRVDITDITYAVEKMLSNEQPGFLMNYADINLDGRISIYDACALVELAFDSNSTLPSLMPAMGRADNTAPIILALNQTGQLVLSTDSPDLYTALQVDLRLPEGVNISKAELAGNNANTHSVAVKETGANTYRLICYSTTSDKLIGSDLVLISLSQALAQNSNIVAYDAVLNYKDESGIIRSESWHEVPLAPEISGISEITPVSGMRIYAEGNKLIVESRYATTLMLTNANGQSIALDILAGRNSFELQSGVYIAGKQKIAIR